MPKLVEGTNGNDNINVVTGATTGDDTIYGYGGHDDIFGSYGDDTILGGPGHDEIYGQWDNDTLKGGGGADYLNGGENNDTAAYGDSPAAVTVSLLSGIASGGDATGDDLISIENLMGSGHADTLIGDNGPNVLNGQGGSDELKGWGGADTLWGSYGHDVLYGGAGADTLHGENGDDYLDGGAGADDMYGGIGGDTYIVDHWGDDVLELGGQGWDIVLTSVSWTMTAGAWIDVLATTNVDGTAAITLIGNNNGNFLSGNDGDNILSGGGGADTIFGHGGNDTYYVDNLNDEIHEGPGDGIDIVRTSVSWEMALGADIETLETTNAAGTAAIDLTGSSISNVIIGNDGPNTLSGGGGGDQMTGLGGDDSYRVGHAGDEVHESGGDGDDEVATSVSWTLTPGADVETLRASYWADQSPLNLTGNETGNLVWGNAGNNVLNGGDGNDELIGVSGEDSFRFDTPLNALTNVDEITDFGVANDLILLDDAIFSAFANGPLAAERFVVGPAALDASDNIIYNSATGVIYYDSDGNGAAAAIPFAEVTAGLALTHLDFIVV